LVKFKHVIQALIFLFFIIVILLFFVNDTYANRIIVIVQTCYTILTGALVYITVTALKTANSSFYEMQKQNNNFLEDQRLRYMPYIQVIRSSELCLKPNNEFVLLNNESSGKKINRFSIVFSNVGLGPAIDIRLSDVNACVSCTFETYASLPVNSRIYINFQSVIDLVKKYEFCLKFNDILGNTYEQKFIIKTILLHPSQTEDEVMVNIENLWSPQLLKSE